MTAAGDRRTHRDMGVAGAMALAAAVACGSIAVVLGGGGAPDASTVAVTIDQLPATVPPRAAAATTTTTTTTTPRPASTTTSVGLSPLSSLIGEAVSARPVPPTPDIAPVALTIADIDAVAVPVRAVGVTPDGQLEIPGAKEAGWYRLGAAPGQPGTTVVAAHVSWQGSTGPFLRLSELDPGASVELTLADGATRSYRVVARAQYGKLMLPREEIWRTSGPETLVLITCGGAFNPEVRRYADNIVVTAMPVA